MTNVARAYWKRSVAFTIIRNLILAMHCMVGNTQCFGILHIKILVRNMLAETFV